MAGGTPPDGYVRVTAGRCTAVVLSQFADDARHLLADGTLYDAAARDLAARTLNGRGIAYSIALPVSGTRAVVRHNRHGGLFAPLTRDLFLPPTRAPLELAIALRLRALGVPTPEILMYGTAPAPLLLQRADVVTREVPDARDLSEYLRADTPEPSRRAAWAATRALVSKMNEAGVRHHDLNVKNVLLAESASGLSAFLLDVDRVSFETARSHEVASANAARLLRSARKWRDERGATFDEHDVAVLGTFATAGGRGDA
ncbi:MAG TPA: lipopolysaccharide kinase InaA family protein [Gemmatimonadaceae bacterium]|jgi:tRNA A-37 threonylcarbamoyl transferase component Bud32|nr:lipopolysaccharide kinase InaA family protein [Gemmatimonadaceae bacterium]